MAEHRDSPPEREFAEERLGGELDEQDAKLVTLARAARARVQASEGSAVRDTDGRTYVAATVRLPSLALSAAQAAVAAAASAGADGLEAAAVVTGADELAGATVEAVRDLAGTAPIYRAAPSGEVLGVLR